MRKLKSPVKSRTRSQSSGLLAPKTRFLELSDYHLITHYQRFLTFHKFHSILSPHLPSMPKSSNRIFPFSLSSLISWSLLQSLNTLHSRGPRFQSGTYVEHLQFKKKKKKRSPVLWLRAHTPSLPGALIPPHPLLPTLLRPFVTHSLNFLVLSLHHRRVSSLPPKF